MNSSLLSSDPIFSYQRIVAAPSWRCDAHCTHCLVPRSARSRDDFDLEIFRRVIDEVSEEVHGIELTGGEPFFYPERLIELARIAAEKGKEISVVTNGAFLQQLDNVEEIFAKAKQAGLCGLALSMDDYHVPALELNDARRLLSSAKEAGLFVKVKGVGKRAKRKIQELMKMQQLDSADYINLEHIGQAMKLKEDVVESVIDDCCTWAIVPMVAPSGLVYACCSTRLFEITTESLILGDMTRNNLGDILSKATRNYLLAAIIVFGPRGLQELLKDTREGVGESRCQRCLRLMGDSKVIQALQDRIGESRELRKEIHGRHMLLDRCLRDQLYLGIEGRI